MTLQSLPRRPRTSCGSPHRPCDMGWVQGAESKTRCGQPPESPGMATVALARGRRSILLSHTVIPPTAGPGSKRAPTRQVASLGLKQHRLGSCRWTELFLSLMWDSPGGGGWGGRKGWGGRRGWSAVLKGTVPPWVQPQERGTDWSQWHPPCHPSYGDERTHTTVGHVINTCSHWELERRVTDKSL